MQTNLPNIHSHHKTKPVHKNKNLLLRSTAPKEGGLAFIIALCRRHISHMPDESGMPSPRAMCRIDAAWNL